ncbi:class I SAM-dependent methyltransferase [Fimbriimonas ginsengisoli]|uniref:Type 11 methyltransferase n=1 Tax=Fimbriimonas ginsengisoli Gsoil 348 TaxID=661478 RepID=A0A068NU77_FIMGI|nr:class I SAM-dependent methyltransferase [Fimbriimonas ginsengisoli]AIE86922.1 type 11 methyltransferase [Fimbriimonas ginsengisoli Gsoil 348]
MIAPPKNSEWAKAYYTTGGSFWSGEENAESGRKRAQTIARLAGPDRRAVLEIQSGHGGAALATAQAGYDVTALDFAPIQSENARRLVNQAAPGRLTVVAEDQHTVDLGQRFDVVACWDGFGIGDDEDNLRLLHRIANDWLAPGGIAILDIFCPLPWAAAHGRDQTLDRNHSTHAYRQNRRMWFDPITAVAQDEWCPLSDEDGRRLEDLRITQFIRCYFPADFVRLASSAGLQTSLMEIDGAPLSSDRLREAWHYLVVLERGK